MSFAKVGSTGEEDQDLEGRRRKNNKVLDILNMKYFYAM